MIINHNIAALNTFNRLSSATNDTAKSLEKLSSGLRINRAGDDAAGLAISEKMRGQISGLNQASRNAQDGISLIQTGEGALSETHSILQRMRELAVQSASDTNTDSDRTQIQSEVDQLAKEITRVSNTTEFNTQNLLAGGLNDTFQIGANQGQNISLSIGAMDAASLGVAGASLSLAGFTAADGVISVANPGSGLTAQQYKITATTGGGGTTGVAATAAAATTGGAGTIGTIGGAYTGGANAQLQIRVDSVTGGFAPLSISVSNDNGSTWPISMVPYVGGMNIGNGLTWTAGGGVYIGGEVISTNLTAAAGATTVQLVNSANGAVGAAVSVNNTQTSATIGDASVGATVTINFAAGGITAGANANLFTITSQSSTAATTGVGGKVTTLANTVAGINVSTQAAANSAISTIDNAIQTVSAQRSNLGAVQNRLEHTINNLTTSAENLSAAESRVRDVDMAKEMMSFTRSNIISQAATAMLAQANQQPQGVLQLLK